VSGVVVNVAAVQRKVCRLSVSRSKAVLPMVEKVECCEAEAPCSDGDDWLIDRAKQQATNDYNDYGIAARLLDSNTGKTAIVRPEWAARDHRCE